MTTATQSAEITTTVKRRSPLAETWDNLRRSWAGMLGLTLIVVHILIAATSPYWVPQDPYQMSADNRNELPSINSVEMYSQDPCWVGGLPWSSP
jgi:ABC-type dipeptide/oligopeptide/nickel transport system permease subunit